MVWGFRYRVYNILEWTSSPALIRVGMGVLMGPLYPNTNFYRFVFDRGSKASYELINPPKTLLG